MSKKLGVFLVGMMFAGASLAQGRTEVLVTAQEAKGGGTTYALDFYSDGSVAGFQFDLDGVGLDKAGIDVSKCGVKAPAGFAGGCTVREGFVRVLFYSAELKSLPKGWHDLGAVTLRGSAKGVRLSEVNVSDAFGKALETGAKIEGGADAQIVK